MEPNWTGKLRTLTIFGTRPEAIKLAPVIARLQEAPDVESLVCITAQHRQMLDQVLRLFEIEPDVDLDLMRPSQPLHELTSAVLSGLQPELERLQPDWVLVQGDTTTVMAAALLSYYQHIPIGHVEAGLRTGDKYQPFPEEINRRLLASLADLHFAPTQGAMDNLRDEGVPAERIVLTGNTVIDALQAVIQRPVELATGELSDLESWPRIVLLTAHRRENFGEPLERIFAAVRRVAERNRELHIVYPVHLNPKVAEPAQRLLGAVPNVHLIEPLDYLPMAHLMQRAELILTDSGGIQEEAPALGTPVLVLRELTERPEALEAGTALLVGTDEQQIYDQTVRLLDDEAARAAMAKAVNPFGDGHAAERIVAALLEGGSD